MVGWYSNMVVSLSPKLYWKEKTYETRCCLALKAFYYEKMAMDKRDSKVIGGP